MPRLTADLRPVAYALLAFCAMLSLEVGRLPAAEAALSRDFNGPEIVWQVPENDRTVKVLKHECVAGGARGQAGLERIVVAAPGGESVHIACPTAHAAVIDELTVRMWLKVSLPGAKLGARIVLPRTPDREHDAPTAVTVFGADYDRPGHWQQVVANDFPKLLAAELRRLRLTAGSQFDPREAYLDAVVLSVPGDPQGVVVETDDLVVDSVPVVSKELTSDVQLASYPAPNGNGPPSPTPPQLVPGAARLRRLPDSVPSVPQPPQQDSLQLQGDILLADERPIALRAIDWQGEPLEFLAQRGFNAVRLEQRPTAEQVVEARRHSMWFVCHPPRPDDIEQNGLGSPSDRVGGWHLQDAAVETDPMYARRWAELIRARDAVTSRAVILEPQTDWIATSLIADVLLVSRERCGISPPADYEKWLAARMQSTRPGTAVWAHFPTQFDQAVGRQLAMLTGVAAPPPNTDAGQLEWLTWLASMKGVRGFVFNSQSALDANDPASRARAAALELINRRLQLIEPWLAGGKSIGRIQSTDGSWTGIILHVDHARLMMLSSSEVQPTATSTDTSFIVPGIPESSKVYTLTPASLKTLPTNRVAGGVRFSLKPHKKTYVLITENPQVIQSLRQRIARDGPRFMQLLRENLVTQSMSLAAGARRLATTGVNVAEASAAMAGVDVQLRQMDSLLAAGGVAQAEQLAQTAADALHRAADGQRAAALQSAVLTSNPLALDVARRPEFVAFQRSSLAMIRGDNLLYGGDFEDLGQMTQLGWKHFQNGVDGVESRAELSTVDPRHGSSCLLLQNAPAPEAGETRLPEATVWIQSPAIPVDAGWLEITGWVRIDSPISGSGHGLQIVDSLGGPDLAIGVGSTPGWQRLEMIRAASEPTEVRLTFALSGTGAARVDAVMIRPVKPPAQAPAPVAGAPALNVRPVTRGPLLVAPQGP